MGVSIWPPMMRRDETLSDSCTLGCCSFSRRVYIYSNTFTSCIFHKYYTCIVLWYSDLRWERLCLITICRHIWPKMANLFVPKDAQCSETYEKIIFQFLVFEISSILYWKFLENFDLNFCKPDSFYVS